MIKYKRIYPMKRMGRLHAIVTIVGGGDGCEIFVRFKVKPEDRNLLLILFDPKTYEYVMIPLEERMRLDRPIGNLTACVIACRNGMFIEFLMEGTANKGRISTAKLKSIIAMDACQAAQPIKNTEPRRESEPEKQGECEPRAEQECEQKHEQKREQKQECEPKAEPEERNSELMDYLRQMEEGTLPLTYVPKAVEAAEEAQPVHVADEIIADMKRETGCINVRQEAEEVSAKYCEFVNPFHGRWDGVWWKVQYPDRSWHYIVGRVVVDGCNVSVLGVPGERNTKPMCLESCDMYAIADNGVGYWLMFQK